MRPFVIMLAFSDGMLSRSELDSHPSADAGT